MRQLSQHPFHIGFVLCSAVFIGFRSYEGSLLYGFMWFLPPKSIGFGVVYNENLPTLKIWSIFTTKALNR
jgi:hypothetical protein